MKCEICVHETHLHFLACPRTFFVREHQPSVCSRTNDQNGQKLPIFRRFWWCFFRFFRVREHRQKQIFAVFTNKEGILRFVHRTPVASFRALCAHLQLVAAPLAPVRASGNHRCKLGWERCGDGAGGGSVVGRVLRTLLRARRLGSRTGGEGRRRGSREMVRRLVLAIRLPSSQLGRWLRWGERRRVLHWWRLRRG